jgi:hypothetical protein
MVRLFDQVFQGHVPAGQVAGNATGADLILPVHIGYARHFRVAMPPLIPIKPVVDVAHPPMQKRGQRIPGRCRAASPETSPGHTLPESLLQLTAIRWSRASLSPSLTPFNNRNFSPISSRLASIAFVMGEIFNLSVHQRNVLLGGGTP